MSPTPSLRPIRLGLPVGHLGDRGVDEHRVGPAVDDDAEVGGPADGPHVLDQPAWLASVR
jgi:hypothetical protein